MKVSKIITEKAKLSQTNKVKLNPSKSIFLMRKELYTNGTTDFGKTAGTIHKLHEMKRDAKNFQYNDLVFEKSSDTEVDIVNPEGTKVRCVAWCVNHYLGLNRHPEVIQRTQAALTEYGTGSGTSAMSGGLSELHTKLAKRLAKMVGKDTAVLYSAGYTANLGALATLGGPNDILLLDKECHASMNDGCKLSGKHFSHFKHNDIQDLETHLQQATGVYDNIFVVVESAYSMSGDLCPLKLLH